MTVMREGSVLCLDPHGFHRIRWTEWGDPQNPRVLVCAHGLTRCGRDFDYLAERMSDEYRVVCPDTAGRGRSDWLADKNDYGYPVYCADAAAMLAAPLVWHQIVDVGYRLNVDNAVSNVTTTLRNAATTTTLRNNTLTGDTTDRFHPTGFDGGALTSPAEIAAKRLAEEAEKALLKQGAHDEGNAQTVHLRYHNRFCHNDAFGWMHHTGSHWTTEGAEAALDRAIVETLGARIAVSYTHLTLPTSDLV